MRSNIWFGLVSLALVVGCAAESDAPEDVVTDGQEPLSAPWVGEYRAVSKDEGATERPYRHERLRIFANGNFSYQLAFSAGAARPSGDAGYSAAGIWKTPFLRANQIKLVEHSVRGARWSNLGYASELDIGRLRLKFENGKLVRADRDVAAGSLCSQGCSRE